MAFLKKIWSWTLTLVTAFVLACLIGIFIIQPYKVEGHSMDPTLRDGQRIYVSKLSHTFHYLPDYGDIVIIDSRVSRERTFLDDILENPMIRLFYPAADDGIFYVKRVIGKPGDTIEFKNHTVYRNGEPVVEPYLKEMMAFQSDRTWKVPENHIFVLGDNRNHSEDSRYIGYIPLGHVLGIKVFP